MYKKITHDIVEEHFDDVAGLSRAIKAASVVTPVTGELPALVINERTLVFRMDSRTLWTRYSLGMINFSVSDFGNLDSTPSVEKNLKKICSRNW